MKLLLRMALAATLMLLANGAGRKKKPRAAAAPAKQPAAAQPAAGTADRSRLKPGTGTEALCRPLLAAAETGDANLLRSSRAR